MISVESLSFNYPGKRTLVDISFQLGERSITALVGPNGAGKTTLLRCLTGLQDWYQGRIQVDGLDLREHTRHCHRRIGYLADEFGLYDPLTVEQNLIFAARTHGVEPSGVHRRVAETARDLGLLDRLDQRTGALSKGLRQRLAIGLAIIHRPKVLVLDEPASGLDPEARIALADLFLALRHQGMTLIVSSHILAELEAYSTHMLMLDQGRLVEYCALRGTRAAARLMQVRLVANPVDGRTWMESQEGVDGVEMSADELRFRWSGDAAATAALLGRMVESGWAIVSFGEAHSDMQGAYLARLAAIDGRATPFGHPESRE